MLIFHPIKIDIVGNIDPGGEDTQQGIFCYQIEQVEEYHDVATRAFLLVLLSLHAVCAHDVEPRRQAYRRPP